MNARESYDEQMKNCGYCRRRHERNGDIVWCKRHVPRVKVTHHSYRIIGDTAVEIPFNEPVSITGYRSYDRAEEELILLRKEKMPLEVQLAAIQSRIYALEEEMERYDEEQRARDE